MYRNLSREELDRIRPDLKMKTSDEMKAEAREKAEGRKEAIRAIAEKFNCSLSAAEAILTGK